MVKKNFRILEWPVGQRIAGDEATAIETITDGTVIFTEFQKPT